MMGRIAAIHAQLPGNGMVNLRGQRMGNGVADNSQFQTSHDKASVI